MFHKLTRNRAVLLSTVGLMALAGCGGNDSGATPAGSGPATDSPLYSLYQQAKTEGKLVIYCAEDPASCAGQADAFEKAFPGIQADSLKLVSATLGTRFSTEKASRAPTADVLLSSDFGFLADSNAKGLTVAWQKADVPGFADLPAKWVDQDIGAPYTYVVWGIAYNTDLVTADEAPKSWTDLLDPKWKGKMIQPACSVSTATAVAWGTIAENVSPDFLSKLSQQGIAQSASGMQGASTDVGSGEHAVQAVANAGNVTTLKDKGAPLGINYPDNTTGPAYGAGLNADPAHPSAQKLFAAWLISKDGSQALFKANPQSVSPYASPEGVKSVAPNFKYFKDPYYTQVLGKDGLNCLSP
jgi:iron(III) transport system substrate-binding protein